jgi:putative hydrolases of HD superfamily
MTPDRRDDVLGRIAGFTDGRLATQLRFVIEIDKLKTIIRQTPVTDMSRRENDAEHSWHLAIMAVILAEYADGEVDLSRVIRMLLVHDLVEIDAGDTFLYDTAAQADQEARELRAAERIFGLLPGEQGAQLRALWDEFEAHESADARFARSMDRLQPFLYNILTEGEMWRQHGVKASSVRTRMRIIADGSVKLHGLVDHLIDLAVERGYLTD